jgi:cadmium resistance protein CadD (predicted permease)
VAQLLFRKPDPTQPTKKTGDLKLGVFFGFLAIVLAALVGAIVLYAMDKDAAA